MCCENRIEGAVATHGHSTSFCKEKVARAEPGAKMTGMLTKGAIIPRW
jgi:hypothetical protein